MGSNLTSQGPTLLLPSAGHRAHPWLLLPSLPAVGSIQSGPWVQRQRDCACPPPQITGGSPTCSHGARKALRALSYIACLCPQKLPHLPTQCTGSCWRVFFHLLPFGRLCPCLECPSHLIPEGLFSSFVTLCMWFLPRGVPMLWCVPSLVYRKPCVS